MAMKKVKITVVKLLNSEEIHGDADLGCTASVLTPECPAFEEGQEFVWPAAGENRNAAPDGDLDTRLRGKMIIGKFIDR